MKIITDSKKGEPIPGGPRKPTERIPTMSIAKRIPKEEMQNTKFLKFSNVCIIVSEVTGRGVQSFRGNAQKTREALLDAVGKLSETMTESEESFNQYSTVKAFSNMARSESTLMEFEGWLGDKEKDYASLATAYADLGFEGRRKLGIDPLKTEEQRHTEAVNACATLNAMLSEKESTPAIKGFHQLVGSDYNVEGTDFTWGILEKRMFDAWIQANPDSLSPLGNKAAIAQRMSSEFISTADSAELGKEKRANVLLHEQLVTAQIRIINLEKIVTEKEGALEEKEGALEIVLCKLEALEKETKTQTALAEKRYSELEEKMGRLSRERILANEPDLPERKTAVPEPPKDGGTQPIELEDTEEVPQEDTGEGDKLVLSKGILADIAALNRTHKTKAAGERGDNTAPVRIERVGDEIIESAREEEKNKIRKAMSAIFSYGFAGKGQLQSKPETIDIPIENNFDASGEELAKTEKRRTAIHEVNLTRIRGYNAWYNMAGRWIRNRREGVIAAYANNTKKIQMAAAGAIGVAALAGLAVGVAGLAEKAGETTRTTAQKEFSRPVAALLEGNTAMDEEPIAKGKEIKKAELIPEPYPFEEKIELAMEKHGLEKVEDIRANNAGPKIRQIYNVAKTIENDEEKFAVFAYLSKTIGKDILPRDHPDFRKSLGHKMSETLVRDIMVMAMGTSRHFGEFGGQGQEGFEAAVKVATEASGTLDGKGGFGGKTPTKGQVILVGGVRNWIASGAIAVLDAGVESETENDSAEVDTEIVIGSPTAEDLEREAPKLPKTVSVESGGEIGLMLLKYGADPVLMPNFYGKYGMTGKESPGEIYKRAKSMPLRDSFLMLEDVSTRIIKHYRKEAAKPRSERSKEDIVKSRTRAIEMILLGAEKGYLAYDTPKLFLPEGQQLEDKGDIVGARVDVLIRAYELIDFIIQNGYKLGGKKLSSKQKKRLDEINSKIKTQLPRRRNEMMGGI